MQVGPRRFRSPRHIIQWTLNSCLLSYKAPELTWQASVISQALGTGGFRRSADGAPHASFSAAVRAWDRAAPALAPALGATEPRNSVLVSRAGEGMGLPLELQLTYTSKSG